jgi:hypothetical protein
MARAYGGTSGSAGGSGFLPTPSRMSLRSWFRFSLVANVLLLLACIHFMHEGGVSPRDLLNSSGHRKPPPPQQKQKFELEYLDTKAPPKAEPVVVEKIVEKIVEKVVEVPMTGSKRAACGMCDVAPELCEELGYVLHTCNWRLEEGADKCSADNVSRFLGYQGSNQRLRRVLAKMRRGDPFTIGIVGGSGECTFIFP